MNGQAGGEFDALVDSYDEELKRGMALSGEDRDFYATHRVAFLAECLRPLGAPTRTILDWGCGTGNTAPVLGKALAAERVVGVDESIESVKRASRDFGAAAEFLPLDGLPAEPVFDLVYCSGVMHHVQPAGRPEALRYVRDRLRPGGYFSLWENNPWNPAITYTMNRSPIDRNAVKVQPSTARDLVHAAGFEIVRVDFLFYFPRPLARLRPLERYLRKLPLGAQYQVLCRRPA